MRDVLVLATVSLLLWLLPALAAHAAVARERRLGRGVRNYRGVSVPLGLGWAWLAWALAVLAFALARGEWTRAYPAALAGGAAALGWLDDRYGGGGPKGFRGHLSALRRGRLTTGLAKMLGVGLLALAAAWPLASVEGWGASGVARWLSAAAVIALTANLVNLLDLRPGRALKAYVVLAAPAALAAAVPHVPPGASWIAALSLAAALVFYLGPALACLPADLAESAMMGDMGANAAGALAGWLVAAVLPLPGLVAAAVALLALNLASERVSFSTVIEGNGVLRRFDALGRTGGEPEARKGETGQ